MSTELRPPCSLLIRHGRIVDPSQQLDLTGDILILDGKIEKVGKSIARPADIPVIDAEKLIVCPGFIDLHCHLREPGFEMKETIESGVMAAAAGGFTAVCCMPNTSPPIDSGSVVKFIKEKADCLASVHVFPIGCVSKGRKGEELAEMGDLVEAGAVGFSDDGSPVFQDALMRHALEYSRIFGRPIMDHCEDPALSGAGVMNEGKTSSLLGLRGIPAAAEEIMVARDIALAKLTGGRLHLCHISTRGSVAMVRQAKADGLNVTAEATPHHLTMTEEWVTGNSNGAGKEGLGLRAYDTNTRVNPPLRSQEDVAALIDGIKDGTIDAIATDHAPHTTVDKMCEFDKAATGITGLETALAALLGLVRDGRIDLNTLIEKLTAGPARVLGNVYAGWGTLKPGAAADMVIFDPEREWVIRPEALFSKGKNTPLLGHAMKGKVMATIVGGKTVYKDETINIEGTK